MESVIYPQWGVETPRESGSCRISVINTIGRDIPCFDYFSGRVQRKVEYLIPTGDENSASKWILGSDFNIVIIETKAELPSRYRSNIGTMVVKQRYNSWMAKHGLTEACARMKLTAVALVSHMQWMSKILIRARDESSTHLTPTCRAHSLLGQRQFVTSPDVTGHSKIGLIPIRQTARWKGIFVPELLTVRAEDVGHTVYVAKPELRPTVRTCPIN